MDDDYWFVDGKLDIPSVYKKRKRGGRIRKIEFIGWASKHLIEFLEAINVDIKKEYSQLELVNLISRYIKEKGLAAQGKKKKVICDEKLFTLFGKKSISRKKIHELLEEHLHENFDDSDEKSSSEEEKYIEKDFKSLRVKPRRSFIAAIVLENVKLIYLKKSLIRDLLQDPTSFEKKVVGSFIRMKSDPNDISQKHPFQLQLVTGVENLSLDVSTDTEIRLNVANFFKEVPFSMLSDDNFSEEEVEDLRKRIASGMLKKFSVKEIELKAQMLHKDITKHWIAKELILLQKRIDHANEKGWRRELFEYLEKRKMLQTPSEQEKLLLNIPDVIAEEPKADVASAPQNAETNIPFSESNNGSDTDVRSSGCLGNRHGHIVQIANDLPRESNGPVPDHTAVEKYPRISYPAKSETSGILPFVSGELACEVKIQPEITISLETSTPEKDSTRDFDAKCLMQKESNSQDEISRETSISSIPAKDSSRDFVAKCLMHKESNIQDEISRESSRSSIPAIPVVMVPREMKVETEMIELSSDEDDDELVRDENTELIDIDVWHYKDPRGKIRGPFSLYLLKRWYDANYFHAGFSVWKTGQAPNDGVLLVDLLRRSFR